MESLTEQNRPESGAGFNQSHNHDSIHDDNEFKICVVCDDRATGYHFNAMTCEGLDLSITRINV